MKKLVALLLVAVLAFSTFVFTACQAENGDSGDTGIIYVPDMPSGTIFEMPDVPIRPELSGNDYVSYKDFGATADGVTDDFLAIVKTHLFANYHNIPVRVGQIDGEVYYIGNTVWLTAPIRTNTDWGSAKIIIDDSQISTLVHRMPDDSLFRPSDLWVFETQSMYEAIDLLPYLVGGVLTSGQERLNLQNNPLITDALVIAEDTTTQFRRKHFGFSSYWHSHDKNDIFKICSQGYVDKNTPIMWNFNNLTSLIAMSVEADTLVLNGGYFYTVVGHNTLDSYRYINRGVLLNRSNTSIQNMRRNISYYDIEALASQGIIFRANPYHGIFRFSNVSDITIRDSYVTGRRRTAHGSSDISWDNATNVSLINVRQTNDINEWDYWGIMGGSSTKNLLFDNVRFSRINVHRQVHNVTILNSTVGYQGILLNGSGLLHIQNTTVYHGERFVEFREDWGSYWKGDVVVLDSIWNPLDTWGQGNLYLLHVVNDGRFDFGYQTAMPQSITIDGLTINSDRRLHLLNNNLRWPTANAIALSEEVRISNIDAQSITLPTFLYKNLNVFEIDMPYSFSFNIVNIIFISSGVGFFAIVGLVIGFVVRGKRRRKLKL